MAKPARTIYVYGYPSKCGGSTTELWHTVKLWRSVGLQVRMYTPTARPDPEWRGRLDDIKAYTVPDIPERSTVVAFCNTAFRADAPDLRARGCRLVYVPCMNWNWPDERIRVPPAFLFDHYVYQSNHQYQTLHPNRVKRGLDGNAATVIHGAFDPTDFPFRPKPHTPGKPFIVGRLSRAFSLPGRKPALDKFPPDLWKQYESFGENIRARVMGWSEEIEQLCGKPPEWAEVFPQEAMSSQDFLASIHCLVPGIGCCEENWPRVGLEAMAAGVPLVVEAKGGWPEMASEASQAHSKIQQAIIVAKLIASEDYRIMAAEMAYGRMKSLTDPAVIAKAWNQVFEEVNA